MLPVRLAPHGSRSLPLAAVQDQGQLAVIAIGAGVLLGVLLFVPFVALSYRRRGGLTFWQFLLAFAALVYFLAIWTFTLLPLPDPAAIQCAGTNTNLFALVDDLRTAIGRPGNTLTDPLTLQLVLNVALFVPLGVLLRLMTGRGLPTALLVGVGLSLLIETTQLTGVWGLYPCAYRVFDVDDLLTNTTGAVVGSLLSLLLPRRLRSGPAETDPEEPRPVTKGRRLLAMLCDLVGYSLFVLLVGVGVQLVRQQQGLDLLGPQASIISGLAGVLLWTLLVLATGRTLGDLVVRLRFRGGPQPVAVARVLRLLGGIAAYGLLDLLGTVWEPATTIALGFGVVVFLLAVVTRRGRGLPGLLTGQDLADSRGDVPADVSTR